LVVLMEPRFMMHPPQMGCRSRLRLNDGSAFRDLWFSHVVIIL